MSDGYDADIVEEGDVVTLDTERGEQTGTVADVYEDYKGRIITIHVDDPCIMDTVIWTGDHRRPGGREGSYALYNIKLAGWETGGDDDE